MKPCIIVSKQDPAGISIRDLLVALHGFTDAGETFQGNPLFSKQGISLYTINERTIDADAIDEEVDGDFIIFATRHQAESGKKCFCVHVPGNWDAAEAGGTPKTLCTALPQLMKDALKKIKYVYPGDEFDIAQECTHHGPDIKKPCMFIEIGSSEDEWVRRDAGEVIANVVNHIITNPTRRCKSVIVLGGGHYNQVATKLMFNTDFAVGHVCPKYALPKLTKPLLKQAIDKNGDSFEMVVLDWKGLGPEKERLMGILESLGVKHERYQRLAKED
ncbi:hypothetical protein KY362_00955 [Candidatus Woesearchaeota archaeon]|nr:hypothetical protein [Candidatus Woesearchaeota archaeon]